MMPATITFVWLTIPTRPGLFKASLKMPFPVIALSALCSQKRRERFWAALLLEEQKPRMIFVQSSF